MPFEHLAIVLAATLGPVVTALILYWIVRLAVRHGIEDAGRRGDEAPKESGYWDPARLTRH
jgi:hypothetical protein